MITTHPYSLPQHDALPISISTIGHRIVIKPAAIIAVIIPVVGIHDRSLVLGILLIYPALGVLPFATRSEEHTSELQSHCNIVCRLLLDLKIINSYRYMISC